MEPFLSITEIAAPLEIADIDTDMLFPAAFLKTVKRNGLSKALFYNMRVEQPDFVLNKSPWDRAGILIALHNFGCGSSREHAPWALMDFGIKCIIAPSFAEIFQGNCFKTGILPIELDEGEVKLLLSEAKDPATAMMKVDLEDQMITRAKGQRLPFSVDPQRRQRLLHGTDDIELSLAHVEDMTRHEQRSAEAQPWLKPIPAELP
ncbi:3-isopropylmalate dehydratase small subunit [Sphingomonas sp. SRS2]|uniref:3-isopropylmalate dehydratase small subunit n=1 Tax=Sphingomonas sp. SRS2 TaxID=133190 RepID=UPI0006184486|nr:3-isopropylmalate dehydratase small subunit [Sphingomonas sp. SRS2]KKC26647.1 3-isopropylmalate dehydratase [Sphingomonas sp. SRS2]